MKKIIALTGFAAILQVHAQKEGRALVDSLIQELPATQNDTIRARLYNKIFYALTFINTEEAQGYARRGLELARRMKWPKGIAVFQSNFGQVFSNAGQYDSAKYYYQLALQTHTQAGDRYNMVITLNSLGTAAQNLRSDYTTAAQYYFKALEVAEGLSDSTLLPLVMDNISKVYNIQKNYPKALDFAQRALRIRQQAGTPDEIAQSLESMGKTWYSYGDTAKARQLFMQAQQLYQASGNSMGLAASWSNLSLVYEHDLRRGLEARLKAKTLWDEVNPMHPEAITNEGNLGLAYLNIVRYDTMRLVKYDKVIPDNKTLLLNKAGLHLNTAIQLAAQTGDVESRSFFTGILAELQEWKGDYKSAFYNYRMYKDMQDSVYSQESKNKIAEAESQRAIDQKNNELAIQRLVVSNQQKTLWGLAGVLVLLGIIGVLLYRQSSTRKKTNELLVQLNHELDDANKVKARFFAILSHDLRAPVARLISFLHLRQTEPDIMTPEQTALHEQKLAVSAEALLENMETVLLWSKSQMEQLLPNFTAVSVTELFTWLQKQFSHVPKDVLMFKPGVDIQLYTDEHCARTILYNLTGNALKALADSVQPQVIWRCGIRDGVPCISITDNGPGLAAGLLQDDGARAAAAGSVRSGLGLTIVKDLAKTIGCIIVQETVSKGTCIVILFPKQ